MKVLKKKEPLQMKRSRLIQRLQAPTGGPNPFSFGGGIRNGGLKDEAMSTLMQIFSFDYMGAAEFEWGAVPESLTWMHQERKHMVTFQVDKVWVICHKDMVDEVTIRITKWAADEPWGETKEMIGLADAVNKEGTDRRHLGWLELDNHFMFFVDEEMWNQCCKLFGIKAT